MKKFSFLSYDDVITAGDRDSFEVGSHRIFYIWVMVYHTAKFHAGLIKCIIVSVLHLTIWVQIVRITEKRIQAFCFLDINCHVLFFSIWFNIVFAEYMFY